MNSIAPILRLKRDVSDQLEDVALVALQHLLPSIEPLFKRWADAGIRRENVFIVGKPYSTVAAVAESLKLSGFTLFLPRQLSFNVGAYAESFAVLVQKAWRSIRARLPANVKRVIILDEGGWLCRALPDDIVANYSVTAIEHTMYGLFPGPDGSRSYPVIMMAACAAKTRFEGPVIADAIVGRLRSAIPELNQLRTGIVGLGNLGEAVAGALHKQGHGALAGYDLEERKIEPLRFLQPLRNLADAVRQCDVILGCTGRDILDPAKALSAIKERRWLASCSSGDVEFQRVARQLAKTAPAPRQDPFRDVRGIIGGSDVILLNGGFPLNFTRTVELEPPALIQLTREITYASVLQAMLCMPDERDVASAMLDPEIQKVLVEKWLANPQAAALMYGSRIREPSWWEGHSSGRRLSVSLMEFLE